MNFEKVLYAAQRNERSKKDAPNYYKANFAPPKKEQKVQKTLSANVQKFLQRKEEEERIRKEEANKKREELLALRSQDKKANKRVNAMLKRTKAANKSVIEDAIDEDNTAVTLGGPAQPDEDDYGYVSQEASAYYNKLMDKYNSAPPEPPKFPTRKVVPLSDLTSTKDRVRMALLKQEEEEMMPHKRKRKSKGNQIEADDEEGDIKYDRPSVDDDPEPVRDRSSKSYSKESKPNKPKIRKQAPPPLDFTELLRLAEKKQYEPVVFETKKSEESDERPMTKKQRAEFEREQEARRRREERQMNRGNDNKKRYEAREDSYEDKRQKVSVKSESDANYKKEIKRIPKLNNYGESSQMKTETNARYKNTYEDNNRYEQKHLNEKEERVDSHRSLFNDSDDDQPYQRKTTNDVRDRYEKSVHDKVESGGKAYKNDTQSRMDEKNAKYDRREINRSGSQNSFIKKDCDSKYDREYNKINNERSNEKYRADYDRRKYNDMGKNNRNDEERYARSMDRESENTDDEQRYDSDRQRQNFKSKHDKEIDDRYYDNRNSNKMQINRSNMERSEKKFIKRRDMSDEEDVNNRFEDDYSEDNNRSPEERREYNERDYRSAEKGYSKMNERDRVLKDNYERRPNDKQKSNNFLAEKERNMKNEDRFDRDRKQSDKFRTNNVSKKQVGDKFKSHMMSESDNEVSDDNDARSRSYKTGGDNRFQERDDYGDRRKLDQRSNNIQKRNFDDRNIEERRRVDERIENSDRKRIETNNIDRRKDIDKRDDRNYIDRRKIDQRNDTSDRKKIERNDIVRPSDRCDNDRKSEINRKKMDERREVERRKMEENGINERKRIDERNKMSSNTQSSKYNDQRKLPNSSEKKQDSDDNRKFQESRMFKSESKLYSSKSNNIDSSPAKSVKFQDTEIRRMKSENNVSNTGKVSNLDRQNVQMKKTVTVQNTVSKDGIMKKSQVSVSQVSKSNIPPQKTNTLSSGKGSPGNVASAQKRIEYNSQSSRSELPAMKKPAVSGNNPLQNRSPSGLQSSKFQPTRPGSIQSMSKPSSGVPSKLQNERVKLQDSPQQRSHSMLSKDQRNPVSSSQGPKSVQSSAGVKPRLGPSQDMTQKQPLQSVKPRQFPPADVKSRPFPPPDVKSRPFPPPDVKSRPFPPPDVKSRPFPPPDVKSRQFPPADVRRKPKPPLKRRIMDSDEEEEYDSEMDDFIDDGPQDEEDYSKHIREIFGYDKSRYRFEDDDDECMESSFSQQQKEEWESAKQGLKEDLEDMQKEKEENRRRKEKMMMLEKMMKKKRRL